MEEKRIRRIKEGVLKDLVWRECRYDTKTTTTRAETNEGLFCFGGTKSETKDLFFVWCGYQGVVTSLCVRSFSGFQANRDQEQHTKEKKKGMCSVVQESFVLFVSNTKNSTTINTNKNKTK